MPGNGSLHHVRICHGTMDPLDGLGGWLAALCVLPAMCLTKAGQPRSKSPMMAKVANSRGSISKRRMCVTSAVDGSAPVDGRKTITTPSGDRARAGPGQEVTVQRPVSEVNYARLYYFSASKRVA